MSFSHKRLMRIRHRNDFFLEPQWLDMSQYGTEYVKLIKCHCQSPRHESQDLHFLASSPRDIVAYNFGIWEQTWKCAIFDRGFILLHKPNQGHERRAATSTRCVLRFLTLKRTWASNSTCGWKMNECPNGWIMLLLWQWVSANLRLNRPLPPFSRSVTKAATLRLFV